MDPSLSGGHRVVYDHEVPFELRVQQVADAPQEVGTLEAVKVKLLLLGAEGKPSAVRMELTSENDLFFNFAHTLDETAFRAVQETQKLMVDFAEYSAVLVRMLNQCIKEPHSNLAVFVMQRGGRGHLDFIQNMECARHSASGASLPVGTHPAPASSIPGTSSSSCCRAPSSPPTTRRCGSRSPSGTPPKPP